MLIAILYTCLPWPKYLQVMLVIFQSLRYILLMVLFQETWKVIECRKYSFCRYAVDFRLLLSHKQRFKIWRLWATFCSQLAEWLQKNLPTLSTLTAIWPFQLLASRSSTLSQISSRTWRLQTVSDVYLKHIFSLNTSAFSVLEVLDNTALYKSTYWAHSMGP